MIDAKRMSTDPQSVLPFSLQIAGLVLAIGFTLLVLRQRNRHASVAIAWIFSFFLIPFLGPLAYLFLSYRQARYKNRRRALRTTHEEIPHDLSALPDSLQRLARLSTALTGLPPTGGNRLKWLEEGADTYDSILDAIHQAKDHVHLEYYIFQPDETGLRFREALHRKAKEGVQCRLLVDHVGSASVRRGFLEPLRESGTQFRYFAPVRLSQPWGMQLRNHRKIAVIDGKTGFTGSQNIGNEYGGRKRGPTWKDSMVRVEGPGVLQLQSIFLEDWQFASGEVLGGPFFYPHGWHPGVSTIQALPTSPLENDYALEKILLELIFSAQKRLTLTTPYFVPSNTLMLALEAASARGVQVDLVIPERSDLRIVDYAGVGWCKDLIRPGIRIRRHSKAFLHAKSVTVDGEIALIGSANMDQRSFRVNFECSVLIYDPGFVKEILDTFERVFEDSTPLERNAGRTGRILEDIKEGAARLFSPLL